MGSFQQITMGVICLVAAFWFGAYLQDRPVGQNQTAQLLPDGTIDPNHTSTGSKLLESTKGFLSAMFDSPTHKKPITVDDLRQRSQIETPNAPPLEALYQQNRFHDASSPKLVNENLLRLTGDSQPAPTQQRFVGSFASDPTTDPTMQPITPTTPQTLPTQAKVAIVPDFSSLAEEVNRGLSFNSPPQTQSLERPSNADMIPVPKFSDVKTRMPKPPAADADWAAVRQQVAAAESRLENHKNDITQPIPDIANSVEKASREFWDRQQTQARRQRSQSVGSELSQYPTSDLSNQLTSTRQSRLKPESFDDKKKRWDVFSPNQTVAASAQSAAMENTVMEDTAMKDTLIEDTVMRNSQPRPAVQPQPTRQTQPKIVEVDRGFKSADQGFYSQAAQTAGGSSSRVRSLNDDRNSGKGSSPYVQSDQNSIAYQSPTIEQPTEVQNQLRPEFDPNPGSNPEFVTPPDSGQFQSQSNSSPSEIVEAAKVAYGSFSEYQTQPDDTLQNISQKFYGSPDYYFDLYLANRALLSNPATVPAGLTIKIPKFDGR